MEQARPKIVCLCGSTSFSEAFQKANLQETLAGNIVLTIGCDTKRDTGLFHALPDNEKGQVKAMLDRLHLHKIDLADEVLILNVHGYVGASTTKELAYARNQGKRVRLWEAGCYECGRRTENMRECFLCGAFCCPQHHYTTPPSAFGEVFKDFIENIIECFSCGCK